MSEVVVITGTSRGIGKALAEAFLSSMQVIGVARNCSIEHENYKHVFMDLSQMDKHSIQEICKDFEEYNNIHIINNAGIIKPIRPFYDIQKEDLVLNHQINFIAPALISNFAVKQYGNKIKTISFIGSGAARHTIDAWSAYCSSKAALLMYAKCMQQEIKDRNYQTKVYDFSPGVVATKMQEEIRAVDGEVFLAQSRFQKLYDDNELETPSNVAKKIHEIVVSQKPEELEINLREY